MSAEFRFAKRLEKLELSGIRRIFDLVQNMRDAVDLSLGQPHFDVPEAVKAAARRAIDEGRNRYTVTQGVPELVEKLRAFVRDRRGVTPDGLFVTGGVAGALFLALMTLVDPGDEVLLADPYFVLYRHLVNVCGGTPVYVDTYPDFRLTAVRLEAAVTPRTRLLLLNSPANPTGVALTAAEIRSIADFARRHELIVLSDEIYDAFLYDFPHESIAKHHPNTIVAAGFGKTYAIPGWRLGYAYGPKAIVEKMVMFQQFSFVCANSVAQYAALAALDTDMSSCVADYRRKRDRVCEGLKDRFELVKPGGAFYVFPRVPWGTDEEFVHKAIENKVLVIPGGACSQRHTHFRVSYAATDRDLDRGIEILNRLARK